MNLGSGLLSIRAYRTSRLPEANTGKAIMKTAAGTLKKLTLELGGNDVAIVMPNTNIDEVAPKIFKAAMFNSGQTCVSIKRVYVHKSQYEDMVENYRKSPVQQQSVMD